MAVIKKSEVAFVVIANLQLDTFTGRSLGVKQMQNIVVALFEKKDRLNIFLRGKFII